ncbi:MAG: hypothetical protein ABSG70_01375 [Terriglobales bacterium]|jgi:hypothetical protein
MAEVVNQAQNEFWRPPVSVPEVAASQDLSEACRQCGTEFIVSSRFCHSCGASRLELTATRTIEIPGLTELAALGKRFGLTAPALAAFLFGLFCLVGALSVGIIFTSRTALDWQAIQLWRIEWLLAAIASFVAGCVLKRSSSQ